MDIDEVVRVVGLLYLELVQARNQIALLQQNLLELQRSIAELQEEEDSAE